MKEELFESPTDSGAEDQDLEIELSSNKRKMLEQYMLTGEVKIQRKQDKTNPPLQQALAPKPKEYTVAMLKQKKPITLQLSTIEEQNEMMVSNAIPDGPNRPTIAGIKDSTTPLVMSELEERERRLRLHQKLIVQMMFQLKLITRLQDDLSAMLDQAADTFQSILDQKSKPIKISTELLVSKNRNDLSDLKSHLVDQLAQYMGILTEPRPYKKFCLKMSKIENIEASFSLDFNVFGYKVTGREVMKMESMDEYQKLILGRNSKNFKRYLKKGQDPQDNVSFSLVFQSRTLDLQAQSPEARSVFVTALKELQKYLL